MSSNCAIVVCDHGLGHIRRCALIAKARERLGVLLLCLYHIQLKDSVDSICQRLKYLQL